MLRISLRRYRSILQTLSVLAIPAVANGQCEHLLQAHDRAAEDRFGGFVDLSDRWLLTGSIWDDDNGSLSGSAYVFEFTGTCWIGHDKLTPGDGQERDYFGGRGAMDGNWVIIGAHGDDDLGSRAGAAYFFRYDGIHWLQHEKIFGSDTAPGDRFGGSIALAGNLAAIGAWDASTERGSRSGAVYVFRFDGDAWHEDAKLIASDGAANDGFGIAVSVHGNRLAVGAWGADSVGINTGAVYLYEHDGTAWVEIEKFVPFDGGEGYLFGRSVDILGDEIAIGAPGVQSSAGAAYVYKDLGPIWDEDKIEATDSEAADQFGISVAMSEGSIIVGAPYHDAAGTDQGAVYQFDRSGQSWIHTAKFLPGPSSSPAEFGVFVRREGNRVAVGAPGDNSFGAVTVIDECCPADCSQDGRVDTLDFLCFLNLFTAGDPLADCDCSGTITTQDFLCFLNLFIDGC